MKAPRLTREMALQAQQSAADGAGGRITTWVTLGHVWADLQARTGREARGASGAVSDTSFRIILRATAPNDPAYPQPGQRLVEGTRRFRIEAVADRDAMGRYLTCFASLEVTP